MSENYQYTDCKHCGQSLMEGQIHNCRQMLLAEIADCHATMLRQGNEIIRLREALQRIANPNVQDLSYTLANVVEVAREALADRP